MEGETVFVAVAVAVKDHDHDHDYVDVELVVNFGGAGTLAGDLLWSRAPR